jgi:hypothetical protein
MVSRFAIRFFFERHLRTVRTNNVTDTLIATRTCSSSSRTHVVLILHSMPRIAPNRQPNQYNIRIIVYAVTAHVLLIRMHNKAYAVILHNHIQLPLQRQLSKSKRLCTFSLSCFNPFSIFLPDKKCRLFQRRCLKVADILYKSNTVTP